MFLMVKHSSLFWRQKVLFQWSLAGSFARCRRSSRPHHQPDNEKKKGGVIDALK